MLDLNLLPVFEAMLLDQNVTAAAARVGVTQSALSNALGRLRHYFDDPLFVKTSKGMLPTPRAAELAQPLREALNLVRAAAQKNEAFDPARSNRTFRLYMTDVGEMVFLPELMKYLRSHGMSIQIETAQLDSDEVAEQLASGEIDFAVGYLPNLGKTIEKATLFREHYVCMTRKNYGENGAGKLTLKNFLAASHVLISSMGSGHQIIERTLERGGFKRNVALRVPHFLVIPRIIADTDLVVTIPARAARTFADQTHVREFPLPVAIPSFDVALFWHSRFVNDPSIEWFRTLMLKLFQEKTSAKKAVA
jgi:DNA-binding transcriptional LysR family regulator